MSGITSGVGIFSGIDSRSIIDQLIAVESRPKQQAQNRIFQLQLQNGAYLDINTRLNALKTASSAFRTNNTFSSKTSTSSNEEVLKATASNTAISGTYQFIVDRLVSSQQNLSRGIATRNQTALGLTNVTLESSAARLDRDVSLSDLNNGAGVRRGKLSITDSLGANAVVDLSRATSVQEVLDTINDASGVRVTASVQGGRFVITDDNGGVSSVSNVSGSNVATDLGLTGVSSSGGAITGNLVYSLSRSTSLNALGDGRGVSIRNVVGEDAYTFTINIAGTSPASVRVNLGEVWQTQSGTLTRTKGEAATVGEVVDRINTGLTAAGVTTVAASINANNGRLEIRDSTGDQAVSVVENGGNTARDLGLLADPDGGNILGNRIFSGLNTTLISGVNGGKGFTGNGVLNFQARDGTTFSTTLSKDATLAEVASQIEVASRNSGGPQRLKVTLNNDGTGLQITDITGATTSNLVITGAVGNDTATSLGISTGSSGVAANAVKGGNLQRQYISGATLVSSLNQGKGIGAGVFRITDAQNNVALIDIASDTRTIDDLLREINATNLNVIARVNSNGDGIEIVEDVVGPIGSNAIKIEDTRGSVAASLNIAGTAKGVGVLNTLNGTYERNVELSAADTLEQVVNKINSAKAGVSAAIIRDGNGATPFRLSLASNATGSSGRVIISSTGEDLALSTLDSGSDSRAFFGSSDPARALVVGGSTNTLDDVLTGVRIDLKGVSANPVSLSITNDTGAIESAVNLFVSAFNTVVDRIDFQSRYDQATNRSQPLVGDGTARELRSQLFNAISAPSRGTTGTFNRLSQIGVSITSGGNLTVNTDTLRAALAQDPASVEALFTARQAVDDTNIDLGNGITARNPNSGQTFSTLSVAGIVEQLADRYINNTSGVLTGRSNSIQTQITIQNSRISGFDSRLANSRLVLERRFLAMEKAIGGLQSQSSALNSIQRIG